MEKIKPATMVHQLWCIDQDFITYVDKIDKIRRELSELKMKSEIQNTTVLSKSDHSYFVPLHFFT